MSGDKYYKKSRRPMNYLEMGDREFAEILNRGLEKIGTAYRASNRERSGGKISHTFTSSKRKILRK